MNMLIPFILGWFGYLKIPKELVLLSTAQEHYFRNMVNLAKEEKIKKLMQEYLDGQETITDFLRGRRRK
jgi:hypothetical protein